MSFCLSANIVSVGRKLAYSNVEEMNIAGENLSGPIIPYLLISFFPLSPSFISVSFKSLFFLNSEFPPSIVFIFLPKSS